MLSAQLNRLYGKIDNGVYSWIYDEVCAMEFQYWKLQASTHRLCLRAELQGLRRAQMLIAEGNAEYRIKDAIYCLEEALEAARHE